MNERGISGSDGSRRARRDASMARKPPSVCESKTKACDEARRRGFGDERCGRSLSEMTKRVKSDETHCRTLSKMPRAAFICPASGTQPFSDEAICAGLHPADVLVYVKGCKDAQIAHIKSGVRLPRNPPQFDKALMRRKDSHISSQYNCRTFD